MSGYGGTRGGTRSSSLSPSPPLLHSPNTEQPVVSIVIKADEADENLVECGGSEELNALVKLFGAGGARQRGENVPHQPEQQLASSFRSL